MSSKDLIAQFQADNSVVLDVKHIQNTITDILSNIKDNRRREAKIGEFVKHEYSKIANAFEFNKARELLTRPAIASTTSSLEFFEGYVNIISEIVKETSDSLAAESQSEENIKKAESALQEAKAKYDEAQSKYQNDKTNENKKAADKAAVDLKNAEERLTPFEAYEPYMDYFGINEKEAADLLENQVNSATYMNVRRAQMDAVGVTDSVFMKDLENAFKNNASYQDATNAGKTRMQQVYATKQLMKEKLDSKTGFWGWIWRTFSHRSEAKAMKNYIKTAEQALSKANFNEAAVEDANLSMMEKGYLYDRYKASGAIEEIKEKFAENERKYIPIRAQKDEINAISKMPINDQFFQIKYRPVLDQKMFIDQAKAYNALTATMRKAEEEGTLPKEVLSVFKANGKKISFINKIRKKAAVTEEQAEQICEQAEKELMGKGAHNDYTAMKYSEIEALMNQKVNVPIDLGDNLKEVSVSKPVEEKQPSLSKDAVSKGN